MPFEYSCGFREQIVQLHRGKEHWHYYAQYIGDHLGGPGSRLERFRRQLVPEIEHHCGPLEGQRTLDVGCGTGASTVALAETGARVVAFDVDVPSSRIARHRLREHGFANVEVHAGRDLSIVSGGEFDLVLMNGVVEHIPASIRDLRRDVVRAAWARVVRGGHLFLTETPNRLIPYDTHSTGLWWIPWTRPGSAWAYRRAIAQGRHAEAPGHSAGPLGLEEVGAWGATYWEIAGYLRGLGASCVNLRAGHDRHLWYGSTSSRRRKILERILHPIVVRGLRAPLTAVAPHLTNLVFAKA
jgi:2-polyprenyl-3-methyl-5-hydroxy-6-metoxy-1,4-benzoquinol methylase